MFAYGIFKVIYSPFKTFEEIIKDPKYIGPILIMILVIAANMGFVYVVISKTYVEQTLPQASQLDAWTENSTLWMSNANIAESDDCISGSYYGNKSMQFSIANATHIWMQLNSPEPINCTGIEGYKNMSFRTKLAYLTTANLSNASLFLYSSQVDYYYWNLTKHLISSSITVWNNFTVPTGPESKSWSGTAEADWRNITRLIFEFELPENANMTVRLDGLFFRGVFKSELENASSYMLSYSAFALMQFAIKWVILSGILYLLTKAFGGKAAWRSLLILVGFALITLFVQAALKTATYAAMPTLCYPIEIFSGVKGEYEVAYDKILTQTWFISMIDSCVQIATYFWTIALCSVALRLLAETSWTKGFLIAMVAYFASIIIESFILI